MRLGPTSSLDRLTEAPATTPAVVGVARVGMTNLYLLT
jgi:hypothetical protein